MSDKNSSERLCVVGAGLVGSLLSIYLARRGFEVDLYDKSDDPRRTDLSALRSSINLSLSERGLIALAGADALDAVRPLTVPTHGRLIHDRDGTLTYQSYGDENEQRSTYSIMRNDLNKTLLDLAEGLGVRFHFNHKCLQVDLDEPAALFENTSTGETVEDRGARIFGADGLHSAVRRRMMGVKKFNYSQQYLDHGYKEVNVPMSSQAEWTRRTDAVHLWPRGDFMLLGLPNPDNSFVCSLHLRLEGETSFEGLSDQKKLRDFFEREFPDAVAEIPRLEEEFLQNSVNYFMTLRCYPWRYQDKVALIGDSAHAIFPFYAQGTNCGFEDCVTLDACIGEFGDDWENVFEHYQQRRKPNADAISDMSREHYHEIRDLVGQNDFQLRKAIEQKLTELDPQKYMSLYTMVTFTDVPYADSLRRGREQYRLVSHLMEFEDILDRFESSPSTILETLTAYENSPAAGDVSDRWSTL